MAAWDASPPTSEIVETYLVSSNFSDCLSFFARHCTKLIIICLVSWLNLTGYRRKRAVRKEMVMGETGAKQ